MRVHRNIWLELGSPNVCDALRALGKNFQSMSSKLRPICQQMKLAGPAFTVRCYPGATWAVEQALELAKPGDILVVDGGGVADVILMGGLMSTRAQSRGIGGAILDGAVRDVEQISALNFPVFARGVCPRAGTFAEIGEWQTTICCGGIPVRSGDWLVADASGIVLVPLEMLDQVSAEAQKIHDRETQIEHALRAGKTLAEAAAMTTRASTPDDTGATSAPRRTNSGKLPAARTQGRRSSAVLPR